MTLSELEKELGRGVLRPVYLLLGPEEFLRKCALQALRSTALKADAFALNYSELSAKSDPVQDVLAAANTLPMMSEKRVVVLSDLGSLSDQQALAAYLQSSNSKTVLILIAEELDRRTSFYKFVRDQTCVVEVSKLKGPALMRWAEDCVRSRGYRISSASLARLVDVAGTDLLTLANEIEKILIYGGEHKVIEDSSIDLLVRGCREHSIFELTDAVGKRDRKRALKLLGDLLDLGESPILVVNMLARHLRQLLIAKELQSQGCSAGEIASAAQVPGFILNDFLLQARGMDSAAAERIYLQLADADRRFKSSGTNERVYLERLLYSL
jgi:DNA polymerase III subunit delta